MKKLIPVLLAALMMLTLLPISVAAAPEGTAIKTAADFEAIANDPAGTYYLANDIDFGGKEYVTCILESFGGKLDGQGYTLFNYSITNGDQNSDIGLIKRIAKGAKDSCYVKNLNIGKADAPIKMTVNDTAQGKSHGFIAGAQENSGVELLIENVNVYGDLQAPMNGKINAAGFVAYARWIYLKDCTMNGTMVVGKEKEPDSVYKNNAGFVASGNDALAILENCTNNANLTTYCSTTEARAAGIVTYTGKTMEIINCTNNGTITVMNYGDTKAASQAAGIIADVNGDFCVVKGCVNNGQINATGSVAGIVAYVRKAGLELDGCVNYGVYTKNAEQAAAMVARIDEAKGEANVMSSCQDLTGQTNPNAPASTTAAPTTTAAPETTAAPTTTTAAPTTTAPVETPATADNGIVFLMVAAMAAVACVFMKKRAR